MYNSSVEFRSENKQGGGARSSSIGARLLINQNTDCRTVINKHKILLLFGHACGHALDIHFHLPKVNHASQSNDFIALRPRTAGSS